MGDWQNYWLQMKSYEHNPWAMNESKKQYLHIIRRESICFFLNWVDLDAEMHELSIEWA